MVMAIIPREDIRKKLFRAGEIDWEYFKDLKFLDRQDGSSLYEEVMFLLQEKDLVSSSSSGNYVVINGFILEPKVGGYQHYFIEEKHAKAFRNTFCPKGLVARVVS